MCKVWAAAAAIVLCLALGWLPVAAQESSSEPSPQAGAVAAVVTGVIDSSGEPWRLDASDPRVSGELDYLSGVESRYVGSGATTIKGPEGDWTGPAITVWNEGLGAYVVFASLEGTGAYEGWAFVHTAIEKEDGHAGVDGVIYQGDAPRQVWPEPAEASTE